VVFFKPLVEKLCRPKEKKITLAFTVISRSSKFKYGKWKYSVDI